MRDGPKINVATAAREIRTVIQKFPVGTKVSRSDLGDDRFDDFLERGLLTKEFVAAKLPHDSFVKPTKT